MDPVAIIVTSASAVTGLTVIIAAKSKIGKWVATKIGRRAVNEIREIDVDPKSFVGQGFAFNQEMIKAMQDVNDSIKGMRADINRNHTSALRVELLQLIHNTPEKAEMIEQVFDNYVKSGGNSYMLQVIEEWRKVYGEEVIRKRIIKR